MYYKALAALLFVFATPAWAAEIPDQFPDTFAAMKWACDNIAPTPTTICIETPKHQVIVMWGEPDKDDKTPVLTLIKTKTKQAIPFVRFESFSSWKIDLEREPDEHFGWIEYHVDNDHITYHTNVKRRLLLQSLCVTECYDSTTDKP